MEQPKTNLLPVNIVANADDFGLRSSVNRAILKCFKNGYINSTSLMANQPGFEEAVSFIQECKVIQNVGVHVDLAEGYPVSNFRNKEYLNSDGKWDLSKTGKKLNFLNVTARKEFYSEIEAQIIKIKKSNIPVSHIDSHFHLHTLPGFVPLFYQVAKKYNLKLRLAQPYYEGNFLKYLFRQKVNQYIRSGNNHYTDLFLTVEFYLNNYKKLSNSKKLEIMLHPDLDENGNLTDHYLAGDVHNWISFLNSSSQRNLFTFQEGNCIVLK